MQTHGSSGAVDFAVYALCLARGGGDLLQAVEHAKAFPDHRRVELVLRSAVNAGTTTDAAWAEPLLDYRTMAAGFIASLRSASIFDRMLEQMVRIPLRTRAAIATTGATGTVSAEGAQRPVTSMALANSIISPRVAQAIIAVTSELMRGSPAAATALLSRELRAGVAAATDESFLAIAMDGAPTISSAGASAVNVAADIGQLLAIVSTEAQGSLILAMRPEVASALATKTTEAGALAFPSMTPRGGTICGVDAVATTALPLPDTSGGKLVLLDASGFAGDSELATLRASGNVALQLDDNPSAGAQNLVSMFQTSSVAILAERWFGVERIRSTAVAVATDVAY